jgi:hypothetical protein
MTISVTLEVLGGTIRETVPTSRPGPWYSELREWNCPVACATLVENGFDSPSFNMKGPVEVRTYDATDGDNPPKLQIRELIEFQQNPEQLASKTMNYNVRWLPNLILFRKIDCLSDSPA